MNTDTRHQEVAPKTKLIPRLLIHSSSKFIIRVPFEQVNISEWLFTLSDKKYRQSPVSHIACGASRAADGRRSLNVEEIGGSLTVQHCVEDIAHAKPLNDITCEFGDYGYKPRRGCHIAVPTLISRKSEADSLAPPSLYNC